MNTIYKKILLNREANRKMLAIVIDPDKCIGSVLANTISTLKSVLPDFIFVGGSHTVASTESIIEVLKEETSAEVILFPGNTSQFTPKAHALLYLSLLSGRNAEYLIGQHVSSAITIKHSKMEVMSTAYILIDGGRKSSVEYISDTQSIPRDKKEIALSTAIAGELLGMKLVYLEAGSGANYSVPTEMIEYVRAGISLPMIVGGGIRSTEKLKDAFDAGADIVVVGNLFETEPDKLSEFIACTRSYSLEHEAYK